MQVTYKTPKRKKKHPKLGFFATKLTTTCCSIAKKEIVTIVNNKPICSTFIFWNRSGMWQPIPVHPTQGNSSLLSHGGENKVRCWRTRVPWGCKQETSMSSSGEHEGNASAWLAKWSKCIPFVNLPPPSSIAEKMQEQNSWLLTYWSFIRQRLVHI